MLKLKSPSDLGAGLLFVAIGVFTVIFGARYQIGSVQEMGPGYFPMALGILLSLLGLVITAQSFALDGPPIGSWPLGALVLILGSVIVFGLVLTKGGLILAIAALTVISGVAAHDLNYRQLALLVIFLIVLSIGVFVYGLKLDLPILPSF